MQKFKTFRELLAEGIVKSAKDMVWNNLSEFEKERYMALAKDAQDKRLRESAVEICKELEEHEASLFNGKTADEDREWIDNGCPKDE